MTQNPYDLKIIRLELENEKLKHEITEYEKLVESLEVEIKQLKAKLDEYREKAWKYDQLQK